MLVYLLAIIVSTFMAYLAQRFRNVNKRASILFLILSFLVLFFVSALRVDVGSDYQSYTNWYRWIRGGSDTYFEPAFTLLTQGVASLTENAQWLFVASAFISLSVIFYGIGKYSINLGLSVYLFTTMSFYFASMNGIRQFIAVAISLIAFGYILKRQRFRYIISVIVAAVFHQSALIMLPMYLLASINYRKIAYIIIIFLAAASTLLQERFIEFAIQIYPMYAQNEAFLYGSKISEIMILTTTIILVVMLILMKKGSFNLRNTTDRVMFNFTFYALLLHTFLAWLPGSHRLSLYFDIALIIIIPMLLSKIKNIPWRNAYTMGIVLVFMVYITVSIGINNSHNVLPYKSIFGLVTNCYEV